MAELDRRAFLASSLAIFVAACTGDDTEPAADALASTDPRPATTDASTTAAVTTAAPTSTVPIASDPFRLGVASGDPTRESVIMWTRLVPAPLEVGGGMPRVPVSVDWEVLVDEEGEEWEEIVARGTAVAAVEDAHSLHIDATGLEPGTWYRYRFRVGEWTSPVGRTRTAPADDDDTPLVLGQGSCQRWEDGYYAAHRDVASAGLDAFVFLGDYIYEGAARPVGGSVVRSHEGPEPTTLDGYRIRYGLYKSDADLQAAHAACPWIVVWDDHEVDNDYAGDLDQDGSDPATFRARRDAAYRAWWEHQPVRLPAPSGAVFPMHRTVALGPLVHAFLLDGRQFRSDQACDIPLGEIAPPCPEVTTPGRTMLGADQETWLTAALGETPATWAVIANQTLVTDLRLGEAILNFDQWDGYPEARARLLDTLAAHGRGRAVVLTGDIHFAGVTELAGADGQTVATELVCTSITSEGLPPALQPALAEFPRVHYVELARRGWTRHTIGPDRWLAEYRVVADVADVASAVETDARFELTPGVPVPVRSNA
jgi:alkaline phosphatase D